MTDPSFFIAKFQKEFYKQDLWVLFAKIYFFFTQEPQWIYISEEVFEEDSISAAKSAAKKANLGKAINVTYLTILGV